MQKIKKILLSFMLLFLSVFCCACSQVTYSTTLKSSGAVIQTIDIDLSDLPSNKQTVYAIARAYYNQVEQAYIDNMISLFGNIYADNEAFVNDTNVATKFDFIIKRHPNFLVSELEESSNKDTGNFTFLYMKKTYASIYAYLLYFCPNAFVYDAELDKVRIADDYNSLIDIPLNSNFEEQSSLFYNKYIQTCNPFYYNNEQPKFLYNATIASAGINVTKGQTLVEVLANATGYTQDEVELIFNFSTPYKRVHSDGKLLVGGDGYTHTWQLSGVDAKVSLWRIYANQTPWYIFAGGGTLLGVIIAFIVLAIIKNIKKKRGLRALRKIADFELLSSKTDNLAKTQENHNDDKQ